MTRRPRRGTPAAIVAAVVLAACALVATVAIQLILHRTPWISYRTVVDAVHAQHWNALVPAIAGGAVALVGLVLLVAAILPGGRTVLPLEGDLDSGASRRSYRSTLRAAASTVDGVSGAKLAVRYRRITATVRTERTRTDGLADSVTTAIERRLDQIAPATRPTVKVRVRTTRSAT